MSNRWIFNAFCIYKKNTIRSFFLTTSIRGCYFTFTRICVELTSRGRRFRSKPTVSKYANVLGKALILYCLNLSISQAIYLLACTCSGIHPWQVEPASPKHGDVSWVGITPRSPVPASQAKLVRFVGAGASALHTFFYYNPGDATGMQGIGVWSTEVWWLHRYLCDLFMGQSVAQSSAQPWHTDPLTPCDCQIRSS